MQQRRAPGRPGGARTRATPATPRVSPATPRISPATPRVSPGRSASRPAAARRVAVTGNAKRTRAPQPHRFTSRATVLACVLGALLLAYAYPVRIYLNQQAQIASLQASQAAQRQRIQSLSDQSAKFNDPEYVTALARSRLLMVKPGDVAYLPLDTNTAAPASTDPDAGRARDTGPWYGQLWSSVQAADKPRPLP